MKKIHLLVPMSGTGTRFKNRGYKNPKPMIKVGGKPMIERLLSCFPHEWPAHFVLSDNHKKTNLPPTLKKLRPKARVSYVKPHKKGPGFAILDALKKIPAQDPVYVSYCDYGMIWDSNQFSRFVQESDCDACIISYRGFHAHYLGSTNYAFSRIEGDRVVEIKEKDNFTDNRETEFASNGGYYFKSAAILKKALQYQIKNDLSYNGEYYLSLTTQGLIEMNPEANVRVYEIPGFFQWGTPDDVENYNYWDATYQSYNQTRLNTSGVQQVLMPMAGLGSRFKDVTAIPKPLIPIDGKPIFKWALESLPKAKKNIFVTLDKIKFDLEKVSGLNGHENIYLSKTPEGQALSVQKGLSRLNPKKDVLVSSCDHQIVYSSKDWDAFYKNPKCDAAIFTISGFPGVRRSPNSYAYVNIEKHKEKFARVKSVSVKKPISTEPWTDPLLVGTFWFKNPDLIEKGIQELTKRNDRVNNELYLDSIFNILIEQGHTVRVFPLTGYINLGDPDSLAEALYWREQFCCYSLERRKKWPGLSL